MSGQTRKTRKRKESVTSPAKKKLDGVSGSDFPNTTQTPVSFPPTTPRRTTRRICLTSTPVVHATCTDLLPGISPGIALVECESCELITEREKSKVDLQSSQMKSRKRCRKVKASQMSRVKRRITRKPTQPCSETKSPPAKRQRARKKTESGNSKARMETRSSKQIRPRFELVEPDSLEQDDSLLSSDLSIELSHQEDVMPSLRLLDEEESDEKEEEEDEELPSFLMQVDKKPPPITKGAFVWHKFRHYPYWPALVKTVYPKQKKASIVFIDYPIFEKKGFVVTLKSLKPFDYEETNELMREAKKQYDAAISWAMELITDYRIRIACGSFSDSFIKYYAHDMSYPVRKMYPQESSKRLNIVSDALMLEDTCEDLKDDSLNEREDTSKGSKRLLPDRTHAAHNRANEKLVHFIVKQRLVETHLLDVICGKQQSRWLRSFMSANRRRVVNIYLEDDQQLDQVYCYLRKLYTTAVATASCLPEVKSTECVPFVLDVLLPEAIIYAIAGVDNVSVQVAEEKYLRGRCISKRERQEFDLMIEKHMKIKTWHNTSAFSDYII
ncbi:unnamed protein product [Ophioblennius macclurei]